MKKATLLLFFLFCISIIIYCFGSIPVRNFYQESAECPFCNSRIIENQQIYTGKWVNGLLNYKPLSKGHVLLIPKRHVSRFENLTREELLEIQEASQRLEIVFKELYGKEDYVLILQNGPNAGQTVSHVHFHMIPKGAENTLRMKAVLWYTFLTEAIGLRYPLSEKELTQEKARFVQYMGD